MRIHNNMIMSPNHPEPTKRRQTEARILGNLMDETTSARTSWRDSDYGAILVHQLNAALVSDLTQLLPDVRNSQLPDRSFRELLLSPDPSLEALRLVKDFAKQLSRRAQLAYPEDVATVLYYASIAVAELRTRTVITELPRRDVLNGYRWAADRPWMPADIKGLFDEAVRQTGGE